MPWNSAGGLTYLRLKSAEQDIQYAFLPLRSLLSLWKLARGCGLDGATHSPRWLRLQNIGSLSIISPQSLILSILLDGHVLKQWRLASNISLTIFASRMPNPKPEQPKALYILVLGLHTLCSETFSLHYLPPILKGSTSKRSIVCSACQES